MTYLKDKNIITQVHYIPIFLHPYYQIKKNKLSYYPNTLKYYETCLSIPIYYSLSISHQRYIINLLKIIDSIE